MTFRRWTALIIVAMFGIAEPASAQRAGEAASPIRPVSDDELAAQRGGFRLGTLEISLGAEIRSYAGDALVAQTDISWTDTASKVQRTFSTALSQDTASGVANAMLAGGNLKLGSGDQMVVLANNGQTAFIQRTDGAIQNIIVNTASNVHLRQDVDVKIDIAGYASTRDNAVAARIASVLSSLTGLAIGSGRLN